MVREISPQIFIYHLSKILPMLNLVCSSLGGHSIGTMAMEAEYSLPQHTNVMNPIPEETQLRRLQPEPYASSAIYTELNYQVCISLLDFIFNQNYSSILMSFFC